MYICIHIYVYMYTHICIYVYCIHICPSTFLLISHSIAFFMVVEFIHKQLSQDIHIHEIPRFHAEMAQTQPSKHLPPAPQRRLQHPT